MVTVILLRTADDVQLVQPIKIQQPYWWGYGLELFYQIMEKDLRQLLEDVVLPEEICLNVVIERMSPTCFECELRGHIKKSCR